MRRRYTDSRGDELWTPAMFRQELGVSVRAFYLLRTQGVIPPPAETRRRGFKGTISLWATAQVAGVSVVRRAAAEAIREAAVQRLVVARRIRAARRAGAVP